MPFAPLILVLTTLTTPFARAADAPVPVPAILDATALKDGRDGRAGVSPCDDFYEFACGAWLDRTVIPADKPAVSRQTTAALDNTDIELNHILEAYAKKDYGLHAKAAHQLRDYYQSCLNMEAEGPAAVKAVRKRVAELRAGAGKGAPELARLVANMHLAGAGPLFSFGSAQDLDDSSRVIGDLGQGGIALGQRDFYFPTDDKGREILARYEAHIAKMLELSGSPAANAKTAAAAVLKFETALAKVSYNLADQNDPSKTHHPLGLAELTKLAPHFAWAPYFRALGDGQVSHMNLDEPEFFRGLDQLLASTSKSVLADYLAWHYVRSVGARLGGEFEAEDFAFWMAFLNGAKQQKPLWKRCTIAVEAQLGYALAEAYVQTFDGQAIKAKTEGMITQIKDAFATDLRDLARPESGWMDAATSARGVEKVAAITQKVGGPEKWRDYTKLRTVPNSYLANVLAAATFESRRDLAKIGKPVDRSEWLMMPWEINAYYDRSKNEFNFPFGILQPPSLDLAASDGANLGAFGGGTIGHELTHGFDNNGSQYDAKGNVKNWWSETTLHQFQSKAACFADQASAYKIADVGLNVNGKNTLEENLADQGGVKLGYGVLAQALAKRPDAASWDGKYNERQQYWIAYAQSWCTKLTTESLRQQMTTDVHPPPEFRVNAVVMNLPEFARDFACAPKARMAPAQRCTIW